jgi:hypothetical protein
MKNLFLPFLLTLSLCAMDKPKTVTTTLYEIQKNHATIQGVHLPVGTSGIVIHRYDEKHRAIVASAVTVMSNENGTTIELLPYRGLMHSKLPTIKTEPQNGDTVILGYLYDRILPIVPNKASFEKAKEAFTNLTLIHPDLFAVELAKEKQPLPQKRHFQRMCEKMHLGLVLFMFQDGSDFIDCVSWKKVGHVDLKSVDGEHFKSPFFHRFNAIPSAPFDWSNHTMNQFDQYYKKLEKKR